MPGHDVGSRVCKLPTEADRAELLHSGPSNSPSPYSTEACNRQPSTWRVIPADLEKSVAPASSAVKGRAFKASGALRAP